MSGTNRQLTGAEADRDSALAVHIDNPLARDFTAASLLRFAFPTIIMMLFMGLYTLVDTVFVARFVNTDALSAVNIVCPIINITVGLGAMFATGGNAVVSRLMGAGKQREANQNFTLLTVTGLVTGLALAAAGFVFLDDILTILGANDVLLPYCTDYLGVLLFFIPVNIVQTIFQNLIVTAGRPGLGFAMAVSGGIANVVLDYMFIVVLKMGIAGAALATGIGYLIPAIVGIVFFAGNSGGLSFRRPKVRFRMLAETCFNGSSEMVGQLASAVTTFIFNITMMRLLGTSGVAAITIIIYSQFLFNTLFIGFSMGVAPIIGFNYGSGADGIDRQKRLFRICTRFIGVSSLILFAVSFICGPYIAELFTGGAAEVSMLAGNGFRLFAFSFLFCGLNIFTSALFTALSNGKISAALSFARTFGFVMTGLLVFPIFWGVTGVWLAVPAAEFIMAGISLLCLRRYRNKYGYM